MKETLPVQLFPALSETGVVEHGFILRIPGLDIQTDRESALQRLEHYHRDQLAKIGTRSLKLAEQIHGNGVATIDAGSAAKTKEVDGLVTMDPNVVLGIYVADCCAVFLVDPIRRVIGLVHSGKKGTERNIVGAAIRKVRNEFAKSMMTEKIPGPISSDSTLTGWKRDAPGECWRIWPCEIVPSR